MVSSQNHTRKEREEMKLKKAIDNIFSHNETIGIWKPEKDEYGNRYSALAWKGMAHELPEKYLKSKNWKIFGTVVESLPESDTINIRIMD